MKNIIEIPDSRKNTAIIHVKEKFDIDKCEKQIFDIGIKLEEGSRTRTFEIYDNEIKVGYHSIVILTPAMMGFTEMNASYYDIVRKCNTSKILISGQIHQLKLCEPQIVFPICEEFNEMGLKSVVIMIHIKATNSPSLFRIFKYAGDIYLSNWIIGSSIKIPINQHLIFKFDS